MASFTETYLNKLPAREREELLQLVHQPKAGSMSNSFSPSQYHKAPSAVQPIQPGHAYQDSTHYANPGDTESPSKSSVAGMPAGVSISHDLFHEMRSTLK